MDRLLLDRIGLAPAPADADGPLLDAAGREQAIGTASARVAALVEHDRPSRAARAWPLAAAPANHRH